MNLSEQTDLPETKGVVDVFGIGFISQGCFMKFHEISSNVADPKIREAECDLQLP